jgi:glutamate carboxypeptidase
MSMIESTADPSAVALSSVIDRISISASEHHNMMLRMLRELVLIESPSSDKAGVDRAVALVAAWCELERGRITLHRQIDFGDLLDVSFGPEPSGNLRPILLLGHLDTVWELGTLNTMPWSVDPYRACGPGVLDMKSGVVMALAALQILRENEVLARPVRLLLHSDEEVGSTVSRPITEAAAQECQAVYVLEPAQGDQGAYKTARKGVGQYRLEVSGIAAHSGVDFAAGHSAILELARQLDRISALTDLASGVTVNPGVIGGGTRSNVIAASAWANIDVRVARADDAAHVEKSLRALKPVDPACSLFVTGAINRPPMERIGATAELFLQAQKYASLLGFPLDEASTGGGSDGNFTSALGVPTLDGMGAVGAGAHAIHEHILLEPLAQRTALLAAMLLRDVE